MKPLAPELKASFLSKLPFIVVSLIALGAIVFRSPLLGRANPEQKMRFALTRWDGSRPVQVSMNISFTEKGKPAHSKTALMQVRSGSQFSLEVKPVAPQSASTETAKVECDGATLRVGESEYAALSKQLVFDAAKLSDDLSLSALSMLSAPDAKYVSSGFSMRQGEQVEEFHADFTRHRSWGAQAFLITTYVRVKDGSLQAAQVEAYGRERWKQFFEFAPEIAL